MGLTLLGSAAAGGVPQWNCGCDNCDAMHRGAAVEPRSHGCVAKSADERWFLLNASPDIGRARRPLQLRTPARTLGRNGDG